MFKLGIWFLSFFSLAYCQRYYAFIETLFVIDPSRFQRLSQISNEDYVRVIVDTANIVNRTSGSLSSE